MAKKDTINFQTRYPELSLQWHTTKNAYLLPSDVAPRSSIRVWWLGPCGHEWISTVDNRAAGYGCPVCHGRVVIAGDNDLATANPERASLWHPTKNGDLLPTMVTPKSHKRVWLLCKEGHEWETAVSNYHGCPYCSGQRAIIGVNDISTTRPAWALEWHPTKNGDKLPIHFSAFSQQIVWWQCDKKHEWSCKPANRLGCPYCEGRKILAGFNDLKTLRPEIASLWHPTKNNNLKVNSISPKSKTKIWLLGKCGHAWDISPYDFTVCPYCAGRRILVGFNDLTTTHPEMAATWHPTKNLPLTPEEVTFGSGRMIWWLDSLGHEWKHAVSRRTSDAGCPICSNYTILVGFNDISTTHPLLAAQLNPIQGDAHVSPFTVGSGSGRRADWICDKGHEWNTRIVERSYYKTGCPLCVENNTESAFRLAVTSFMSDTTGGALTRICVPGIDNDPQIDILGTYKSLPIIIEYDGVYWHNSEQALEKDERYTKALLSAGYVVVRIRERSGRLELPFLPMTHPHLLQIENIYDSRRNPAKIAKTVKSIFSWVDSLATS